MEKIIEYTDPVYKLQYNCIDSVVENTLLDIEGFKIEYCLSEQKFKHVKKNVIFHFLFLNTINYIRELKIQDNFKLSLFISEEIVIKDQEIITQIKALKKLLPIPLLVFVNSNYLFRGNYGPLKEQNNKIMSFYQNRKVKLKELKKHLNDKGFSALSHALSSVVDLKGFYY